MAVRVNDTGGFLASLIPLHPSVTLTIGKEDDGTDLGLSLTHQLAVGELGDCDRLTQRSATKTEAVDIAAIGADSQSQHSLNILHKEIATNASVENLEVSASTLDIASGFKAFKLNAAAGLEDEDFARNADLLAEHSEDGGLTHRGSAFATH